MRFSEKLILLRKRKGLTQQEFSRAVGVSRQSVYKWESGQSYPEASKLLEIRRLFDVSIDHLLDDTVVLPFSSDDKNYEKTEIRSEKITKAPVHTEIPSVPVREEKLTIEIERSEIKEAEEAKKPELPQTSTPRPAHTAVSVQKRKKKPTTLREIVGAFFGKRR